MNLFVAASTALTNIPAASAAPACDSAVITRETELVGTGSDYARLAELSGEVPIASRLARRGSTAVTARCVAGPWSGRVSYLQQLKPGLTPGVFSVLTTSNSAYPEDRNNGAVWSGRGLSTSVQGGAIVRGGPITLGLSPVYTHQQNRDFVTLPAVVGFNEFGNGLYPGDIDLPQRFGAEAYTTVFSGESFIRADAGKFAIGLSSENVWWGPGSANAILLSNTAPGFPHVFTGLSRLNVGIGRITTDIIWGKLTESQYFDAIEENDNRLLTGAMLTFEPRRAPGLFLGFGRIYVVPWDSISGRTLFPFLQPVLKKSLSTPDNPQGRNEVDDQRISFMARYVLPRSGFEIYAEWAREDHSYDKTDLIGELEHGAAHLIGFQKLFAPSATRWFRFYGEVANLQTLRQVRPNIRAPVYFYVHKPQGHTELGQLLGAAIGPGSESQLAGMDVLGRNGLVGFYLERVRRDEMSTAGILAWSSGWPPRHDVATTPGIRLSGRLAALRVDADLSRSKRFNRNFIRDEVNLRGVLRVTWTPPSRLAAPSAPAGPVVTGEKPLP